MYVYTGQGISSNNMFAYCNNNPVINADSRGTFFNAIIGGLVGGIVGGITAAINGDNIWAGVGIGAATGAVAGLCVDIAVATGGVGAIVIAGAGGMLASGASYAATETVNGRDIDMGTLVFEATVGGVFNIVSFGTAGGSMAKVGGKVIDNLTKNFTSSLMENTTRKVAGKIAYKSATGVAKNIAKNIGANAAITAAIAVGQWFFARRVEATLN